MEALAAVAFVIVLVGVFVLVGWIFRKARRRERAKRDETVSLELQRLAEQQGWEYERENADLPDRFEGEPFQRGSTNRLAFDVVSGTYRGRSFCCFQYVHTTRRTGEAGGSRRASYFWVSAVSTSAHTPMLQVTKADGSTRFQSIFGRHGFRLGDEQFDKTFRVSTDDEQFAQEVLNLSTMQWMLLDPRAQQLPFRFERDELVTWHRQRGRSDPASITPPLDYLCDLLDRVPSDAWR